MQIIEANPSREAAFKQKNRRRSEYDGGVSVHGTIAGTDPQEDHEITFADAAGTTIFVQED
jgi:hypothetical protein